MAAHGGALRWVRALTLALVMLSSGLSSHVAAGGVAPVGLVGPMLLLLTLAVSPFLDSPASSARVVGLVLAGQTTIHVVLGTLGRAPAMAASMTMPASQHHHRAGSHLGMFAAHLAAALVVALWLAAGERAAWTLLGVIGLTVSGSWLAIRHLGSAASAFVAPACRPAFARSAEPLLQGSVWEGRGGHARRGPPYACVTA